MTPGITRSLGDGFRAALRSWPAIGLLIGGWLAAFLVAALCIVVTSPPPELFEEAPAADRAGGPALGRGGEEVPYPDEGAADLGGEGAPAIGAEDEAGSPEPAREDSAPTADNNLFDQLQTPPAEPSAAKPEALTEEPSPAPDAEAAQRGRIVGQWFGRAWPMVVLCVLVVLAANLWLTGGQIGYLARRLRDGTAPLSEFWQAANRAFMPLLGAGSVLAVASAALAVGVALLATGLGLLGRVLPAFVMSLLGLAAGAALFVGMVWLLVRVTAFWFIAVVADRLGPIAGLKTGFRATRTHFWRLLGLGLLVLLISLGAGLPFALLEWIGATLGGGAGGALGLLGNLLGGFISIVVGVAVSAAFIRFYLDARGAQAAAGPSA